MSRPVAVIAALGILCGSSSRSFAKAVETFQIVIGNEVNVAEGSDLLYFENVTQLQKSWATFERNVHTVYLGAETLIEPQLNSFDGHQRFAFDTASVVIGYRYQTYLPDWYNLNLRLRVPVYVPSDPFGRTECPVERQPAPGPAFERVTPQECGPRREYYDRLQLIADPLLVKKTWNLFTLYDRNRLTMDTESIEYSNKLKLIDVTPDLEFPIAMYVGDEVRFKKDLLEPGGRIRNEIFVGVASNFFDWMHLGIELAYHSDTKQELNGTFISEVYLELYFDVFFDNTFGADRRPVRQVYEEARD